MLPRLGSESDSESTRAVEPRFDVGDRVVVKEESLASRWRKPHLRVPGYLHGCGGVVERRCGAFGDPEFLAFSGHGEAAPTQELYRVRFSQADVWPEAPEIATGALADTIDVEIYDSWLLRDDDDREGGGTVVACPRLPTLEAPPEAHDHSHSHVTRGEAEASAVADEGPETPGARLAEALVEALVAKEVITKDELRRTVEAVDALGTQAEGPRIVARAWVDDAFRRRLLEDATAAAAELGIGAANSTAPTVLTAVENTPSQHNLVVCTLCSCYPLSILGLSPPWYKSRVYRARAVRRPRELLRDEFGLDLAEDVSLRVHDSTADLRYIVIPQRPKGTETWSEEDLVTIVTRDSMIGVAVPTPPERAPTRPESVKGA